MLLLPNPLTHPPGYWILLKYVGFVCNLRNCAGRRTIRPAAGRRSGRPHDQSGVTGDRILNQGTRGNVYMTTFMGPFRAINGVRRSIFSPPRAVPERAGTVVAAGVSTAGGAAGQIAVVLVGGRAWGPRGLGLQGLGPHGSGPQNLRGEGRRAAGLGALGPRA